MVISRIQKSGRVLGTFPQEDARIIDQFMDDVILSIGQTTEEVGDIINNITIIVNSNFIIKLISSDITIPSGAVVLQRDPIIAQGVNITVNQDAEFLIL